MRVTMVRTGVANIASVAAALKRLGAEVELTSDAEVIRAGEAVVLPGVGSFGAGMEALRKNELDAALTERIDAGRPTLAVCLGLQLLCASSEETSGVTGLGVLPVDVVRLPDAPRLPHFGWNRVRVGGPAGSDAHLLRDGDAYFAHTFCLQGAELIESAGWRVARTIEGSEFVSAVERGAVLACQFHPELSGAYGASLLQRWLDRGSMSEGSACSSEKGVLPW